MAAFGDRSSAAVGCSRKPLASKVIDRSRVPAAKSSTLYTITGNGVTLLEGITAANTSGTNTLNLPLTLGASQTFVSGNAAQP